MSSCSTKCRALLWSTLLLAACEPQPGDYWVYRVAFEPVAVDSSCWYPEEEPPPDVASDQESYLFSSTLTFYDGPDGLMLGVEMPPTPSCAAPSIQGRSALTLVENDDVDEGDFYFQTVTVDAQFLGVDQYEAVLTETTTTAVPLEIDGSCVSGELVSTTVTLCDFITASPSGDVCPAPPPPERKLTWKFSGVELDDVHVTKAINPPPPPAPEPAP